MATNSGKRNLYQHSQVWVYLFLTICFTLCGAGACAPLDMGGGGGPKKWTEFVEAGNRSMAAGDYAAAEASFQGAEKICAKEFGKDAIQRATCLGYLAQMYRAQQEYRKASLAYKELIEIYEKTDPKSSDLANFKSQYATVQQKMKDYGISEDPNAPAPKSSKPDDKKDGKKSDPKKPGGKKH